MGAVQKWKCGLLANVRAMLRQPRTYVGKQCLGLLDALVDQRWADGVTVVVIDVALFAQTVEYHHRFGIEPNGQWKRLGGGLMMTWLAFGGAVPMS